MNAGAGPSRLRDGVAGSVADDDFDAYVADLILADAKASQAQHDRQTTGKRRTLFDPSAAGGPGPKPTNKRFLSNIIRDVDAHNRVVIRQQQQAADDANARRRRDQDRPRHRSTSPASSNGRNYNTSPGPSGERESRYTEAFSRHLPSAVPSGSKDRKRNGADPGSLPDTGSKMDKYFEDSYDPAFDIDMSRLEDSNTGLIGELPDILVEPSGSAHKSKAKMTSSESANWTEMLDVVKERDAEKARRKAERAERRVRKAERAAERDRRTGRTSESGKDSAGREWDRDKDKDQRRSLSVDDSDSDHHSDRIGIGTIAVVVQSPEERVEGAIDMVKAELAIRILKGPLDAATTRQGSTIIKVEHG
ncbi:hypothetical protein OC845_005224 [Tilletia horrida]|nr:hypothetical protein OC845_005224 [Tilletia horrida]